MEGDGHRGSTLLPGAIEWSLVNKRTGEARQYTQTELSIEGEGRMLALVREVGAALTQTEFPWDMLAELFSDATSSLDWNKAIALLGSVAETAPGAVVDSALILFGIFPRNEDGTANPDYAKERAHLLKALTFTLWVDLIKVFAEQNDYKRLADPFGKALTAGASMRPSASAT